jgi:putative two-component system hydrogenase maturation factor HypX/HoxX
MAQKVYLACKSKGHEIVRSMQYTSAEEVLYELEKAEQEGCYIDAIICPFLTSILPKSIYEHPTVPCLILHPGVAGDRGPSAIDWALHRHLPQGGVTILQAEEEADAGPVYATRSISWNQRWHGTFGLTKSSVYRRELGIAALECLNEALHRLQLDLGPRILRQEDIQGQLNPLMKQSDRAVDWTRPAHELVRHCNASDSQPGVLSRWTLPNSPGAQIAYLMYGFHEEQELNFGSTPVQTILGHRDGAILVSCGQQSSMWISHLKPLNKERKRYFKLPATSVLHPQLLSDIPHLPAPSLCPLLPFGTVPKTWQQIWVWEEGDVAYLWFNFVNGAMSTRQCQQLCAAWDELMCRWKGNVLVLMGGLDFFSNGIHLNVIESADDPAEESWLNINAIDDVVHRILSCDRRVVAAFHGNAGAGGVMMALAADLVWSHDQVVLNPSYKSMALYGSEYWTYSLPKRVGVAQAQNLTSNTEPVSSFEALEMGLIDQIIGSSAEGMLQNISTYTSDLVKQTDEVWIFEKRNRVRSREYQDLIERHRAKELLEMQKCFQNADYHSKRRVFVYKSLAYACVQQQIVETMHPTSEPKDQAKETQKPHAISNEKLVKSCV